MNFDKTCWILVFVLILFVFLRYWTTVHNSNLIRHKTKDYDFAHFSYINESSKWLYPELLFTSPIEFTLEAGDTLYIPPQYWHWVRNENETFALNFWYEQNVKLAPVARTPTLLPHFINNNIPLYQQLGQILSDMSEVDVEVWFSDNDTKKVIKLKDINNQNGRPLYVITLAGYQVSNDEFRDMINKFIEIPECLKIVALSNNVDYNTWFTSGRHDTGLHKDDREGLLCVLKGRKQITIYPPSDSKYLAPMSITPQWARHEKKRMYYNAHIVLPSTDTVIVNQMKGFIRNHLPDSINKLLNGYSSSRLLFESLMRNNAPAYIFRALGQVYNLIKTFPQLADACSEELIWGWKKNPDGTSRWELYLYMTGKNRFTTHQILEILQLMGIQNDTGLNEIRNNETQAPVTGDYISVVSVDLHSNTSVIAQDLHIYYGEETPVFPVEGKAKWFPPSQTSFIEEADFIMSDTLDWIHNYQVYFSKLHIPQENQARLWKIMQSQNCTQLILFHKYKTTDPSYLVLYCEINDESFFRFADRWEFDIAANRNAYRGLVHEVGIGINLDMKVVRAAIYGGI